MEDIADEDEKERARGNDWADHEAKAALSEHPSCSVWENEQLDALIADATVTARIIARGFGRWPHLKRAERESSRLPRGADGRTAGQRDRSARLQARRQGRRAARARREATHDWSRWRGVARCTRCLARRTRSTPECPPDPHPLVSLAAGARALGHQVWAAALLEQGEVEVVEETPLAICRQCGGWGQGLNPRKELKLKRSCAAPTLGGTRAWINVARGRYPSDARKARVVALAPWPADEVPTSPAPQEEEEEQQQAATPRTPPAAASPAQRRLDALRARVAAKAEGQPAGG